MLDEEIHAGLVTLGKQESAQDRGVAHHDADKDNPQVGQLFNLVKYDGLGGGGDGDGAVDRAGRQCGREVANAATASQISPSRRRRITAPGIYARVAGFPLKLSGLCAGGHCGLYWPFLRLRAFLLPIGMFQCLVQSLSARLAFSCSSFSSSRKLRLEILRSFSI